MGAQQMESYDDDESIPTFTSSPVGEDGNAFAILGRVSAALRRAGVSAEEVKAYTAKRPAPTTTTC
jgi:hypothetical protein